MRLEFSSNGLAGAWAELVACELLLAAGYEVYRNIAPSGTHDLVISKPNKFQGLLLDVTLGRWRTCLSGKEVLDSSALGKLRKRPEQFVLVVTDRRELFWARPSENKPYEGQNGFELVLEPFSDSAYLTGLMRTSRGI